MCPSTYVNASPQDFLVSTLMTNEILHPVDVVQPQGNGRNKPFHGDVDGKAKILLQEGTGQSSHRLGVLEIQAERHKQRLRVTAPSLSPHPGGGRAHGAEEAAAAAAAAQPPGRGPAYPTRAYPARSPSRRALSRRSANGRRAGPTSPGR